jgi:hypothetical protein
MIGCAGTVPWANRADPCPSGCPVCNAEQWIANRNGVAPKYIYWTDDNLLGSGFFKSACYVSKIYGLDNSPSPLHVCGVRSDRLGNYCSWSNCTMADIPPPPSAQFGGCLDPSAGTLCCAVGSF